MQATNLSKCWFGLLIPLLFLAINEYGFQAILPMYNRYDNSRIIEILMLLVLSIGLLLTKTLRQQTLITFLCLPKSVRMLIGIFFAIGLFSAALAPLPKYAFLQVGWYSLLFCFLLLIATLYQLDPRFKTILLASIILASTAYVIYAFEWYCTLEFAHTRLSAIGLDPNYNLQALIIWPGFANARFLMQFLSYAIPLSVLPILLYRRALSYWVWPCYVFASYLWCLDIANQSRSVPLQVLVATIVILLAFRDQALPWLKQQFIVLVIGLVLYLLLFHVLLHGNLTQSSRDLINYADPSRLQLWKQAGTMALSHPILGVGPLHFPYYAHGTTAAHPHNAILLIAAEWGIIALMCLLMIAWSGIWQWLKMIPNATKVDFNSHYVSIALTAALAATVTNAMVDGVIVTPLSQIMLIIIIGWMLGIYFTVIPNRVEDKLLTTLFDLGFLLILGISMVLVFQGIWPDVTRLQIYQEFYLSQCHYTCLLLPDFWSQGFIQFYAH